MAGGGEARDRDRVLRVHRDGAGLLAHADNALGVRERDADHLLATGADEFHRLGLRLARGAPRVELAATRLEPDGRRGVDGRDGSLGGGDDGRHRRLVYARALGGLVGLGLRPPDSRLHRLLVARRHPPEANGRGPRRRLGLPRLHRAPGYHEPRRLVRRPRHRLRRRPLPRRRPRLIQARQRPQRPRRRRDRPSLRVGHRRDPRHVRLRRQPPLRGPRRLADLLPGRSRRRLYELHPPHRLQLGPEVHHLRPRRPRLPPQSIHLLPVRRPGPRRQGRRHHHHHRPPRARNLRRRPRRRPGEHRRPAAAAQGQAARRAGPKRRRADQGDAAAAAGCLVKGRSTLTGPGGFRPREVTALLYFRVVLVAWSIVRVPSIYGVLSAPKSVGGRRRRWSRRAFAVAGTLAAPPILEREREREREGSRGARR
mmetsp:Transcript_8361/g.25968  ORF Transcript_8361/g.25968 Transcript_8361/m.25968 type:complete len:426 (-) Transcript_8361:2012-3289(-)